jgi:putative membrane protein
MEQQTRERLRGHVPALTGLLTVISLALVFGAVLGYVPERILPHNDGIIAFIPHINAVLSLAAIGTILAGVRAIRRGNVARHRTAMLTSAALFGTFLLLYLYRISLEGPTKFDGPTMVRQFFYLPVLAIHILLAIACIPFVYWALLLAMTHRVDELPATAHPRVGRIAASLWLISFALGVTVYVLLYILF